VAILSIADSDLTGEFGLDTCSWRENNLRNSPPKGATAGPVTVTTPSGALTSNIQFVVP
jgi:hypothetical protein